MGTKITVETTRDDGTVSMEEYKGSAFTLSVVQPTGVATESSINGTGDGISLLTGAVAAVAGIAKNNGLSFNEIVEMVAKGTSDGVQVALGHKCTNCGKCGKKVN